MIDVHKLAIADIIYHTKFGIVSHQPNPNINISNNEIRVQSLNKKIHKVDPSDCSKLPDDFSSDQFNETWKIFNNKNKKLDPIEETKRILNMNKEKYMYLPDIQQTSPEIKIALNRVGISDFKMPTKVITKEGDINSTTAVINCYVDLDKELKGINMSRIPQSLHKFQNKTLNSELIKDIAENIRVVSDAEVCEISYSFDYFLTKLSPVNKEPGLVNYPVTFIGIKSKDNFIFKFVVRITATSLCPCSKEISQFGAHNQKCHIDITCQRKKDAFIWIEDIINIGENASSCEIFSVLKRPDEKWITEKAYNNPKFVEDVARDCYKYLIQNEDIEKFKVKVSSDESIHMHQAVAIIET